VVEVSRVTKVVKGGKQLSFRAVVVVGNKAGKVGVGVAKAKEVIIAVQKAVTDAKKTLTLVPITETSTVPHKLTMHGNGSCDVMIRPSLPGSGITAGGSVRAVLELAGYKNVNAKMLSGSNPLNNGRATLEALREMRTPQQVARQRGLSTEEVRAASAAPRRRRAGTRAGGRADAARGARLAAPRRQPYTLRLERLLTSALADAGARQVRALRAVAELEGLRAALLLSGGLRWLAAAPRLGT